ncbi:MAG: hypothetical protein FWC26_04590 [Fibromonadales bacterium]|nr:hypothetical protein [Fibromonadales bacterium]
MRLFPDNIGFWRKWSLFCIMFICSCMLAAEFFAKDPNIVSDAEFLAWIGGAGLAIGFVMQLIHNRKK